MQQQVATLQNTMKERETAALTEKQYIQSTINEVLQRLHQLHPQSPPQASYNDILTHLKETTANVVPAVMNRMEKLLEDVIKRDEEMMELHAQLASAHV